MDRKTLELLGLVITYVLLWGGMTFVAGIIYWLMGGKGCRIPGKWPIVLGIVALVLMLLLQPTREALLFLIGAK